MKIQSIYIKNMHKTTEEIIHLNSGMTYFVGPNGAGKSTILQAIQLALLGYIPGTNKTNESIFSHSSGSPMIVEIRLDDDGRAVTVRRKWSGKPGSIKASMEIVPEDYDIRSILEEMELPVFNFNDFVGMTANQLKAWFIKFLPKSDQSIDWNDILVSDDEIRDKDLIPTILAGIKQSGVVGGAEEVAAGNTYMKQLLSFKKTELSRHQSTIQSLVYHDDISDLSEYTLEELREKLSSLQNIQSKASENNLKIKERNKAKDELATISAPFDSADNDVEYIKYLECARASDATISKLTDELKDMMGRKDNISSEILSISRMINNSTCPILKTPCDRISDIIDKYKEKVTGLKKELSELDSNISNKNADLIEAKKDFMNFSDHAQDIANRYARKGKLLEILERTKDVPDDIQDIEKISEEIKSLTDVIIKMEANERYNKLIDQLTVEKYKLEQSIALINSWVKKTDANNLQTKLMEYPFMNLQEDISIYLKKLFASDDVMARFNLSNKANSFSFGVEKEGRYIPYDLLSSGEKCVYALSLMICLVERCKSSLKLIMVDDMFDHLDNDRMNILMEALSTQDNMQFIFAGVNPCDSSEASKKSIHYLSNNLLSI